MDFLDGEKGRMRVRKRGDWFIRKDWVRVLFSLNADIVFSSSVLSLH